MKKTEYRVIYLNGNEEIFYAFGFTEAIISAMYYAMQKNFDMRIKTIEDDTGLIITDIEFPDFRFVTQ